MSDYNASDELSRPRTFRLVIYNLVLTTVFSLLLYQVILLAAAADAKQQTSGKKAAVTTVEKPIVKQPVVAAEPDSLASDADSAAMTGPAEPEPAETAEPPEEETPPADTRMIAYVLWAISLAGGLGGVLCNLRGVFEFTRDQSYFPAYLELPFYLRPVSGVLCGLFTFFVSSFFSGALAQGDGAGWQTLPGMFPYIGIAFIAGFASQEFMERLKETAKTLFGGQAPPESAPEPVVITTPPPPPPAVDDDPGHESFRGGDDDAFESFKKETKPPVTPPPPPSQVVIRPPRRRSD